VKNGDRNISKDSQEKVYENNLGENQGNENLKRIFDPQLRESIHLFPLLYCKFHRNTWIQHSAPIYGVSD